MQRKHSWSNILSRFSATFGGLVWIFQDGHPQNLLAFQSAGSIDATQPALIFAIAIDLSMDYEVFLLGNPNWWAPIPLRWLWQRIGFAKTASISNTSGSKASGPLHKYQNR